MFRVARKIRVGRETGNTHIFFFGLMYVLVTCKYEKDRIKKKAEKTWRHRFHHYKSMGIFSDAQGQLTP